MAFTSYCLVFICSVIIWKFIKFFFSTPCKNPFEDDTRSLLKAKVTDQKLRDSVLKQNFKFEKIPEQLDAIVIGSGIGGLSTAALLAKSGKKVLVLEQHDQAGGCCHSFIDKGYEFDVGIHYIGDMHFQSFIKTYVDQISDGQINWELMNEEFDDVVFSGENGKPARSYSILGNIEKQKANLKKHFPNEEAAIEEYYKLCRQTRLSYKNSILIKFLPLWLVKIFISLGLVQRMHFFKMNEKSVEQVVNELTSNQTLRDIFCYCYGDYGCVPGRTGFPIQALLTSHFSNGSSYPVGGASEIAHSIIPVIERSGGMVVVRAEVTEILLDSSKKVRGVKLRHGKQEHEIPAPLVISSAGLYNTFQKFLPADVANASRLNSLAKRKHAVGATSVFVGLDASAEELGVGFKKNFWVFSQNDIGKTCTDYLSLSREDSEESSVPLMFISFPSTKDPTWEDKYPGKTTMAIITLSNYDWFKDWEKEPCMRRGDEYEGYKKTLGWKLIDQAITMFPKIKDHIDYVNVGSPLSNNFYLGSTKGEIYGLDHDQDRFRPLNYALLRPTTDIPGLYLSGQDVFICGFSGALYGGLLCAQQVLGRNLFNDLAALHNRIKKGDKEKEE